MRVIVAVAIVIGLRVVAFADGVSPGPLAHDHAALEGTDNCIKCHAGGAAISAPKCLACHVALGKRIAANAGYHASTGADCAKCHPDHRGPGVDLVRWPGGRDHFDHGKLASYKLDGGHAKVACRGCHKEAFLAGAVASALTAAERPRTFLGAGTTCVGCHADIHKPTLGTDCQRCHDARGWHDATTSKAFDHGKTRYPLVGAHVKVECTQCHHGTAQKLADLHPAFDTCRTCHPDPHAATLGTAATACATCHRETSWKELHYDAGAHPKTTPLAGGHAKPTCAACHGEKLDKKLTPACLPCHADPHKPSLGTRCESCHPTTVWTTSTPKVEFHDRTSYPLRGRHTTVACAACHDPKQPAAKRYRPLPFKACLDCHADPHLGETSKPCETCHAVDGWKPAHFEASDHGKTRFPLDGAHRAVPCAKCHPSPPLAPGFNLGNAACERCHADPHGAQLKGGCASCHGVTAWAPSTFTKAAHAKAGFALEGKHDVACGRCHAVARFTDVSTECGACHADRHAGQFAGRKCGECHAGAVWTPTPGFDHAKPFELRGRHAATDCVKCHPAQRIAGADTKIYRLGARSHDCTGCHREQHGDARSTRAQPRELALTTHDCKLCHGEASWRALAAAPKFDHAATGTLLVGGHATAACSTCHQGTRVVPALADCTACHQDRHGGRMGDRCESCHSATSWKQDRLLVDHQRTRLPLIGAHAVQGCPSCHKNIAAGTYRGLSPACAGCHEHTIEERRPHPDHNGAAFARCEDCHSSLAWRPSQLDHSRFWPLTGKHQALACSKCHQPSQTYESAPTQCIGCHPLTTTKTPHDPSGTQCEVCHSTSGWVPSMVDHTRLFPLGGHHAVPCKTCHTVTLQDYSCTTGPCHTRPDTDGRHRGVGGYVYESHTCKRCHPGG